LRAIRRRGSQPAFGYYRAAPGEPAAHAHGLIVLTLAAARSAPSPGSATTACSPASAAPDPAALARCQPGIPFGRVCPQDLSYQPKVRAAVRASATGRIFLVRHARPAVDPELPADQWELTTAGRAAAQVLGALTGRGYYVASDEPKALQTVREMAAGWPVTVEPGFGEVQRPGGWSVDYQPQALGYLEGAGPDDWEPPAQVTDRFDAAVTRHAQIAADRQQVLIAGTHGLAVTIWLASRVRLEPSPAGFWASLGFPDLIEVDLSTGQLRRH
jgi:broad specificity phosphatase PhoE